MYPYLFTQNWNSRTWLVCALPSLSRATSYCVLPLGPRNHWKNGAEKSLVLSFAHTQCDQRITNPHKPAWEPTNSYINMGMYFPRYADLDFSDTSR